MSRLISFPQAFALNKGANYPLNANFTGLPIATLRAAGGFKFNQPAFQTPAANLFNSATVTYAFATTSTSGSAGLVYKFGGNLVDTAIKWTNGKSLGNWYQIQKHGNVQTGGTVSSNGKVLKITCGSGTVISANRSLIHDTKFQRNGNEITEQSASVIGYLHFNDTVTTSVYFKGYVEPFNFNEVSSLDPARRVSSHTIFFVGYRYLHSQINDGLTIGGIPLDTFTGDGKGFGFQAIRVDADNFVWHCIVVAETEVTSGNSAICFAVNTNLNAFVSQRLQVTFVNGVITWFANGTQVATVSIDSLETAGNVFNNGGNANYACVTSIKGGPGSSSLTIPGTFTINVEEAAVIRNLPHTFNNFEDTDTEVTATDIAYQTTGLQLLKKLK